ncbi:D-arabinono-1,4-lactone oxidase [Brachybacterium sp. AOP42-B2-9]|uniref:D-arabinono-1,4-lactone oxidase n=1 Tax=Brachybacterium sp. AOP42-B2-9 TaxID=3457672 RepID=UPI00403452EC
MTAVLAPPAPGSRARPLTVFREHPVHWISRTRTAPTTARNPHRKCPARSRTIRGVRPDATPSRGDEIQTEYFVDRRHGADALAALHSCAEHFAHLVLVSELRTVAADDLWLSPSRERDSLGIHFTWANNAKAVMKVLPVVEAALAPFSPRPHWGKWFTFGSEALLEHYPQLPAFRDLAETADPRGKFRNDYLERSLGLG